MDPISTGIAVTTYLGQKALTYVEDKFGKSVIQRWTRYRAQEFFDAFVAEVAKERQSNPNSDVDQYLDRMFEDPKKSEVLFDAYRRVAFSESKNLGPRIIGLLTARLIVENRRASRDEDKVFRAAESVTDDELIEFNNMFQKYRPKFKPMIRGYMSLESGHEEFESDAAADVVVSDEDLEDSWGSWAMKLKNVGLLSQYSTQRGFEGGYTIKFMLSFSPACPVLAGYIERASQIADPNME